MDHNLFYIIGQILGAVAVLLGFIAFQSKTQLGIIIFQCASALVFSAHYALINAPTAVALNFLSAIICVVFAFRDKRKVKSKVEVVVSSILIIIAGAFAWENIFSAFLILGLVWNAVSLSFSNPQNTRRAMLIKSPLCMIYNVAVMSVGGIVYECAVLTSSVIGLIKNRTDKNA